MVAVVAVLLVAPIAVATIRAGLHGWVPAFDEAHTVLRARHSLGIPPLWLGIYTDASNWIDSATYFPGPWWLWWMALPIRVLGSTWGPLLSIAALNIVWLLGAAWAVRRRLGDRAAMAVLVFLAALVWGLGNAALYSASGQVMIVPAFAACLFIAWAVAAGDEGVLPVLALVTNFILLDEVVLVRLLPPIVVAAVGIWLVGLARSRNRPGWPAERRRARRAAVWATVITGVMWIPSLIQQFTEDPGNLTNLWRVAREAPVQSGVWARAADVLIGFAIRPPFWLGGSRESNLLFYDAAQPGLVRITVAVGVLAAFGLAGRSAFRRRDRAAASVLALAAVTLLAAWYNLAYPPTPTGVPTFIGHYLSTWAVAMFVTFALLYAGARAWGERPRRLTAPVALVAAALLAVVNVPHANHAAGTYAATDEMVTTSATLNDAVLDAVADDGAVRIAPPTVHTSPYVSALAVALADAGIPFCVDGIGQWSDLDVTGCAGRATAVTVRIDLDRLEEPVPGATVVARLDRLSAAETSEADTLAESVTRALDRIDALEPTPEYEAFIETAIPPGPTRQALLAARSLDDPGTIMVQPARRLSFAGEVANVHRLSGSRQVMMVRLPGVADEDLLRWAELEAERSTGSLIVTTTR